MNKDKIKEKLANLRIAQTHTWTAILVTASGSLSLLWSFERILSKMMFILGILFAFFLLDSYLNRNKLINKITKNMEN